MQIPLKEGLFTTAGEARLLAGRCPTCACFSFPAQAICPYCSRDGCETVALSAHGIVEVCTTVINRPPGYEGTMPFGFGVVELPEGIRIISRIANPAIARPGAAARLIIEPLCTDSEGREVMTYAFEVVSDA
jgi:uncharacterized protein